MNETNSCNTSDLRIIGMRGCEELASQVDYYLKEWHATSDTFIADADFPRFGSGEAKAHIVQSMRGHDVYIISDCFNYGVTYKMYGMDVPMSPDDHFQDLKRAIGAIGGKARRITVIMPMLYEGRQHKRTARESLDCAIALQELVRMGVSNIITFDAHDARVQNAIPLAGFDDVRCTYQMIKALCKNVPDVKLDRDHIAVVSPDEGGMSRCMYYSSVLGVDIGMFYKRRNYAVVVNGTNPIEAHEYLGRDLHGKDAIIVDDMISSGGSILDVASQLKQRGAERIFVFSTFGLFCNGLDKFDDAYAKGMFDKIFTTNLIYRPDELKKREWYAEVNMCKYISYIIDTLNKDHSISELLNPVTRIHNYLDRRGSGEAPAGIVK
ncbi:MAG: ribose-phosphate pyrophosphokinase [Clostridiales bacterium]|nr:ribose-phosphate pyrophosphokinase [Clostridiales bacterium]